MLVVRASASLNSLAPNVDEEKRIQRIQYIYTDKETKIIIA